MRAMIFLGIALALSLTGCGKGKNIINPDPYACKLEITNCTFYDLEIWVGGEKKEFDVNDEERTILKRGEKTVIKIKRTGYEDNVAVTANALDAKGLVVAAAALQLWLSGRYDESRSWIITNSDLKKPVIKKQSR